MFIVENLKFSYGDANPIVALKGVTFKINEGEFVGIAGPVGSGKSTLGLLISGLLEPTFGTVAYKGKVIGKDVLQHNIWQEVGFVNQQPEDQIFESTVFDEIAFALKNASYKGKEIEEKVYQALMLVGLTKEFADRSPFKLSGGEKRQVAIASIIAYDPRTIIFDEPTADLDDKAASAFYDYLKGIKGRNTVFLISHKADELQFCDRLLVLKDGKLLGDGETGKIMNEVFPKADLPVSSEKYFVEKATECGLKSKRQIAELVNQVAGGEPWA